MQNSITLRQSYELASARYWAILLSGPKLSNLGSDIYFSKITIESKNGCLLRKEYRGGYTTHTMLQRHELAHLKENFFSFQMQKILVFYLYFWLRYSHRSKMVSKKYFNAFIKDIKCLHWRRSPPFGRFTVS